MLFKIGTVLLAIWLFGVSGPYQVGDVAHVFLLVGMMLLLLGLLKARDAVKPPGADHP